MESVPNVPARQTTYETLYCDVRLYCNDLGIPFDGIAFDDAIDELQQEQCIVYFDKNYIQPSNFGLLKFIDLVLDFSEE